MHRRVRAGTFMCALVVLALVALGPVVFRQGGVWTIGTPTIPRGGAGDTGLYVRHATALLGRYDGAVVTYGKLLDQRDVNPALVLDPEWSRANDRVVEDLHVVYSDALELTYPDPAGDTHRCIIESTRLTYLGSKMLQDGFLTDGHGAYYLGSHGNWNLNLGTTRMATCRTSLALLTQPR